MTKKLSDRRDFKDALILAGDFMSNPGSNGECELGVRWLESKTEIWQWVDGYGSEVFDTLPKNATRRQIIEAMVDDERYPSTVSLNSISVSNDKPPLGALLSLIWVHSESRRKVVKLMNHLSDDTLNRIAARNKGGLLNDKVCRIFWDVEAYLHETDIDMEDLSPEIDPGTVTALGILKAFKEDCTNNSAWR